MKIHDFKTRKKQRGKIVMVTCYDYPSACTVGESKIDCVLVGDSVAMSVHGHKTTLTANLEMMELHTAAVARGLKQQFLITDIPFLCHRVSLSETVQNARRLMQAGAQAIKIEGSDAHTCNTIRYLVDSGVPVMGHIGLTPQSIHQLGGYTVQGKTAEQATALIEQAKNLEQAGCFALVIECVPSEASRRISEALEIPTIGIGAGSHTDGQVLVWHDLLGLQLEFKPRFVRQFLKGHDLILSALNDYVEEVQKISFPSAEYAF